MLPLVLLAFSPAAAEGTQLLHGVRAQGAEVRWVLLLLPLLQPPPGRHSCAKFYLKVCSELMAASASCR